MLTKYPRRIFVLSERSESIHDSNSVGKDLSCDATSIAILPAPTWSGSEPSKSIRTGSASTPKDAGFSPLREYEPNCQLRPPGDCAKITLPAALPKVPRERTRGRFLLFSAMQVEEKEGQRS